MSYGSFGPAQREMEIAKRHPVRRSKFFAGHLLLRIFAVVGTLVVIAAILFPVFAQAKISRGGDKLARAFSGALHRYQSEHNGRLPGRLWNEELKPYFDGQSMTSSAPNRASGDRDLYGFVAVGDWFGKRVDELPDGKETILFVGYRGATRRYEYTDRLELGRREQGGVSCIRADGGVIQLADTPAFRELLTAPK